MDLNKTITTTLSKAELLITISVVTVFTQVFVNSFRLDVYEPITDYIFPNLFKELVVKNPGKRPIQLGLFLRKVIIWILSIFLIVLLF